MTNSRFSIRMGEVAMARSFPTLQPFYYLDHFHEMIAFLHEHYPDLNGETEGGFLRVFDGLSKNAQALVVRMANRQGRVFARESLRYEEIGEPSVGLEELALRKLVRRPEGGDLRDLFAGITKARLLEFLVEARVELRGRRSWAKPRLVEVACQECAFEALEGTRLLDGFVIQGHGEVLDFLSFLYFGRATEGRMQAFTLRDLGVLRAKSRDVRYKPRYAEVGEARMAFKHARLKREICEGGLERVRELARSMTEWPAKRRDELVALLGGRLEKGNLPDEALEVFEHSEIHPARERRCRLLFGKGEMKRDEVRDLLKVMLDDPSSDEELLFAEDFYRQKFAGIKVGRLTRMLRESPVIRIDEAFKDGSERAAANYFGSRNLPTYRAENHFWMTLFGVLFWEELQDLKPNEFDPRPTALLDGSFAEMKAEAIVRKLSLIGTEAASGLVREVFENHFGKVSGLFRWRKDDEALLVEFLETAPAEAVVAALRRIVENPKVNSRGYPDLLQIEGGKVRFIEIKAQGDQIRRHQLVQMQALERCGFEVEVVRIEWCFDPDQEYVVVDLETTGGRSEYHRVTEIGAVKVRGREVVGTFQSLVDPERKIPPKITQLTGISDRMVSGKPVFAELADEFREFVGESILVAHNVPFDYGFLRQEYGRLEQGFRRPTVCTVVGMRRYFPGLKSYSLGKLCREFGIELEGHHRALCDAKATAQLLMMMNEKRK